MESYDSLDYDGARKLLNQALAVAKKGHLDKDPIVAKAYLDLGIVAFAVPDLDAAKLSFLSAVQIEPKIQIDVAYRSSEIAKLLDQARQEAASSGDSSEPAGPVGGGADCTGVKGLEHTIIDNGKAGAPLHVEAMLGGDVKASKVSVMYRPEGASEFSEVKMTKQDCKYTGSIPAKAMKSGAMVHYYIAAYNDAGKPVASKGSQGSPNIIEVTGTAAAAPKGGDDEDPIGGKKKVVADATPSDSGGEVDVTPKEPLGPNRQHVMVAVTGGYGFGYVTGTTEGMNTVKNCCIGQSPVVLVGELAYFVSPQVAIGGAFRLGLPIGANVDGHATAAPAGLLRVHYAFAPSGEGIHVMGQIGAGFLRNTIKLDNSMPGMDTDIVAQGPLLLGAGVGLTKHLTSAVAFIADLSALAGLAVVNQVGGSPVNSGISADLSLGFAVGF